MVNFISYGKIINLDTYLKENQLQMDCRSKDERKKKKAFREDTSEYYKLKPLWSKRNRVCTYCITRYLLTTKGKGVTLKWRHQPHRVIMVGITTDKIYWHHVPPATMHGEYNITPSKMHNPNLIPREQNQTNANRGHFTK